MARSETVTEALLEMHFFRTLVSFFEAEYGAQAIRFWKPSANAEAHLGFDQGWFQPSEQQGVSLETAEMSCRKALGDAIAKQRSQVREFYFGFFMQYKVVEVMSKRRDHTPKHISGRHLRASIDTRKNKTTNLSQHETLIRLSKVRGADVGYACGMVFSQAAIWTAPDLDDLVIVPVNEDVAKMSKDWGHRSKHHIYFQSEKSMPFWCSEPMEGKRLSMKEWARQQKERSARDIIDLLDACDEELRVGSEKKKVKLPITVIEFRK